MGFNIVAPYMEFLHLNWYIAEWNGWLLQYDIIPASASTFCYHQNISQIIVWFPEWNVFSCVYFIYWKSSIYKKTQMRYNGAMAC